MREIIQVIFTLFAFYGMGCAIYFVLQALNRHAQEKQRKLQEQRDWVRKTLIRQRRLSKSFNTMREAREFDEEIEAIAGDKKLFNMLWYNHKLGKEPGRLVRFKAINGE